MFDAGSVIGPVPEVWSDSAWRSVHIGGCVVGVQQRVRQLIAEALRAGDYMEILLWFWMVRRAAMAGKEGLLSSAASCSTSN